MSENLRVQHLTHCANLISNPLADEDDRMAAMWSYTEALQNLEHCEPEEARALIATVGAHITPLLMTLEDTSEPLELRRTLLNLTLPLACHEIATGHAAAAIAPYKKDAVPREQTVMTSTFSIAACASAAINAPLILRTLAYIMTDNDEASGLRRDAAQHYLTFQSYVSNNFRYPAAHVDADDDFATSAPRP